MLSHICDWIAERGEAPTIKEIGEAMGMRSKSSVHHRLEQIEQRGFILREPSMARGITLLR